MDKLLFSVIGWVFTALLATGIAALFIPIEFRSFFWTAFLIGFIGEWLIKGLIVFGENERKSF